MSLATLRLGRLKGISRPAIATLMPNIVNRTLLLDVGANTDCKAENLFQFAIMGEVYAREIMQFKNHALLYFLMVKKNAKAMNLPKKVISL